MKNSSRRQSRIYIFRFHWLCIQETEYVKPVFDGIDVFRTFINGWYDGTVQKIFFAEDPRQNNKNMICSVLAGYVWDQNNPYVTKHKKRVETLAKVIEIQSS